MKRSKKSRGAVGGKLKKSHIILKKNVQKNQLKMEKKGVRQRRE